MSESILGISAFYHDSAAVLLSDGEILAAAQEERFTRKKHDASFPSQAVAYVLKEGGINFDTLDAVAFYEKPYIKFERLLETYHAFAPCGLKSFLAAMPVWVKEKLFMRGLLRKEFSKLGAKDQTKHIFFPEHHLSHAASAFYPSPFEEAAILTVDGVGEWAATTIGIGKGKDIKLLREQLFPHSLGLVYSAFTYYCGFCVNSGEYKLMGLAPYGNPNAQQTQNMKKFILDELIDLREDGSFLVNMDYFNYATGLTMCCDQCWEKLFGIPRRLPETDLTQPYMNMAAAIQQVTEEIMLRLSQTAHRLTGSKYLTMAGGVALNCVANGKILRWGDFKDIWIQPAAGDAGGALGAALAVRCIHFSKPISKTGQDKMGGAYLGPRFSADDIMRVIRGYSAVFQQYGDFDQLIAEVARLIDQGMVVGWFQGRMEYGPRALGARSILGDPRCPDMQKKLNLKIKHREDFRPFAPSVLEEDIKNYFDLQTTSPYMLLTAPVKAEHRKSLPAVTHVDYSARIQSVNRNTNEPYWKLINAFKQLTGYSLLVNTSFNLRGEPIVCTPKDAYCFFMATQMDWLVMENFLFDKQKNQNGKV